LSIKDSEIIKQIKSTPEDGWRLSNEVLIWIVNNFNEDSIIIELGSGLGSKILSEKFQIWSIEHDKEWVGKYPNINYIYSPLKVLDTQECYDFDSIQKDLPIDEADLLIIDGPPGIIGRSGVLKFMHLFDKIPTIIVDDIHRQEELMIANAIVDLTGGVLKGYECNGEGSLSKRKFAIIKTVGGGNQ
jgi:hypothetical protein